MAINKKLIHFLNLADFETRLANNEILDTSIVFIKDAKKIWTHGNYYDGSNLTDMLNNKQDALISGTNIKTVNGESILGEGDLTVEGGAKVYTWNWDSESASVTLSQEEYNNIVEADIVLLNLVGIMTVTLLKTDKEISEAVGSYTLTGYVFQYKSVQVIIVSINISTKLATMDLTEQSTPTKTSQLTNDSNFVSSDNLKTINGESIVGSGDIVIEGGNSDANVQAVDTSETLEDINTNTYVKYVVQTLTDAQKSQARTNIGVNLSDYATTEYVNTQIGDINSVLTSIINQ